MKDKKQRTRKKEGMVGINWIGRRKRSVVLLFVLTISNSNSNSSDNPPQDKSQI